MPYSRDRRNRVVPLSDDESLLQKRKGLFFVFEGTDGAGTTTQCRLLGEMLTGRGHQVICTREPGGTPIGERIRELVLDSRHQEMFDHTELLLYAAARAQHVKQKIRPALEAGKIVICDRFTASTIAYQSFARGIDFSVTENLNRLTAGKCIPDHTFYLRVSLTESRRRRVERKGKVDRMEGEGNDFQQKVIDGFEQIADQDNRSRSILDASQNQEALASCVLRDVLNCWPYL